MTTREAFIAAVRAEFIRRYPWAEGDGAEGFVASLRITMETDRNIILLRQPALEVAWKQIGCKGKPTFKGMRALTA